MAVAHDISPGPVGLEGTIGGLVGGAEECGRLASNEGI